MASLYCTYCTIQKAHIKNWWIIFVTGFAKTQHNDALALSRHTNERAKDSQVCFNRQHFADPVNPLQYIQRY